jgi:hypothetical protein
MSAAPDTPRGRETERLMLLWRQLRPEAEASAYNREWESVYRKLEFLDGDELTQAKLDYLHEQLIASSEAEFTDSEGRKCMIVKADPDALTMGDNDRRWAALATDDTRDPMPRNRIVELHRRPKKPKRICKANYPATKGAFGKPKHLRRR